MRRVILIWVSIAVAACTETERPPKSAPVAPDIDLTEISERAARSFRKSDDGSYRAATRTMRSVIDQFGQITATARHQRADGVVVEATLGLQTLGTVSGPIRKAGAGLRIPRGFATEIIELTGQDLHQSWEVSARPSNGHDLQVVVAFSLPFVSETQSGFHFTDRDRGIGFMYGRAVWLDARHRRTAVETICRGERCTIVVPDRVLEASAYPAVLDPILSAEVTANVPVVIPRAGTYGPAAAFDGTNHLFVWSDQRGSPSATYAARVTPQGSLLDPVGILVGSAGCCALPAVAFGGSNHLVAWSEQGRVVAARVSPQGIVLDATPIEVMQTPAGTVGGVDSIHASFGDGAFLVVVEQFTVAGSARMVRAVRLTAAASVIDTAPFVIADEGHHAASAGAASGHLVTWTDSSGLRGLLVPSSSPPQFDAGVTIAATTTHGATTSNGTDYLVAYLTAPAGPNEESIYARYVSAGGVPSAEFLVADGLYFAIGPTAASDGTNYVVSWNASGFVVAARLGPAMTSLDDAGVRVVAADLTATISCSSTSCIFAPRNNALGLRGVRLSSAGTVLDATPFVIAGRYGTVGQPLVASNGSGYLLTWFDNAAGTMGVRVSRLGSLLDDPPFVIRDGYWPQAIASNGVDYLVVVRAPAGTAARRVYADGGLGTNQAFQGAEVAVAGSSDGGEYLAAVGAAATMNLSWLSVDGTVTGSAQLGTSVYQGPRVASDGENFVVTWTAPSAGEILTLSVPSVPNALDGGPLAIGNLVGGSGYPSIAFGAEGYLLVTPEIGGLRLDRSGVPVGNRFTIAPRASFPEVAFDGEYFVVATYGNRTQSDPLAKLEICRVTRDGGALDCHAELFPPGEDISGVNVASAGGQRSLVAYQHGILPETTHIKYRMLDTSPGLDAGWCAFATDCMSGFCVDNVCCDSACGGGVADDCVACSVNAGASRDGTCGLVHAGFECRPQLGVCDLAELCSGADPSCPPNHLVDAGVVCRPAQGQCDSPDECDGVQTDCLYGFAWDAGTSCDDQLACTTGDVCTSFTCQGSWVMCPDTECTSGGCDLRDGGCMALPIREGEGCDAGTCRSGVCFSAHAGDVDAGEGRDGGETDAGGQNDSGLEDSGFTVDAGVASDGGTTASPDAGSADAGTPVGEAPQRGCGCTGSGADSLVFALIAVLRHRQRVSRMARSESTSST